MSILIKKEKRKSKAWLVLVMTLIMAAASILPVCAEEEKKQYQVLFHAGGDGTFSDGSTSYEVPGGVPYEGNINVDLYNNLVKPREGYYFTGWSKASGQVEITKKTKFVAQYARLIDEVVYRVNYVDTEGNPVATQKVAATNKGASVSETAVTVDNYGVDAAVKTIVADKDKGAEITFVYTLLTQVQPGGTEQVVLPGGTTITVLPAERAVQGGATGQGPSVQNPAAGETEETQQAGVQDGESEEADFQEIVESPDGEVPLANRTLASNLWIYGGGALGLLALTALGIYLYKKRKKSLAGLMSLIILAVSLSGNVTLAEDLSPVSAIEEPSTQTGGEETAPKPEKVETPEAEPKQETPAVEPKEETPAVESEEEASAVEEEEKTIAAEPEEEDLVDEVLEEEEKQEFEYRDFPKVETVDSNTEHITLNLFDYSTGYSEINSGNNRGINREKRLKFVSVKGDDPINSYTQSNKLRSGIVENQLLEGYPYLAGENGVSLDYLFNPSLQVEGRETYAGMNHLFYKNADGYYVFDSNESYAEADVENKRFTVYDATPQRGKAFYPFDSLASVYRSDKWVSKGNGITYLDPDKANHYLGLTMSADFYQPKNGRLHGQDMVFQFTGDDDVWVFIDGMLILDMGGIHDEASGEINFATGQVTINGEEKANMFDTLGETFEAYSSHSINFFYLERGNFASNCKLKFNLPTIPRNSVKVTKEVVDEQDEMVDYAEEIDFHFLIDQNGQDMAGREYLVYKDGEKTGTGTTDGSGEFTLRHGQTAVFSDLLATDQYEVKELGAYLNGYEVQINETEVDLDNTETGEGTILPSASTGNIQVSETDQVTFKNKVSDTAQLSIQKTLAKESEVLAEKEYAIRLKLGERPYRGTYHVGESEKRTEDGVLRLKPDETASISGLPFGISFEVEEIGLDGSFLPSYSIQGDAYDIILPKEDGEVASASGKIAGDCSVDVENRLVKRKEGTSSVTVTKKWTGKDGFEELLPKFLQVTLYEDLDNSKNLSDGDEKASGQGIIPVVKLREENQWQYTWKNLKPDTDYIVVEELTEGYEQVSTKYENRITKLTGVDRVTSCVNLTYELGKNNLLLVKQTGGAEYFLWSAKDLKLTSQQLEEIRKQLQEMELEGDGNIKQLSYHFGVDEYPQIKLDKTANGWKLQFEGKSVWAQFWTLKYDREQNITIENTVQEDKLRKSSLKITKQIDDADFEDGDPIFTFRITDRKGNTLYRTLRFTKGGGLTKSILVENLPLGVCTVEELRTMRYTCESKNPQEVEIVYRQTAEVLFVNGLSYDKNFSHTDVVENSFTIAQDGTVTCKKNFLKGTESRTEEEVKVDESTEN